MKPPIPFILVLGALCAFLSLVAIAELVALGQPPRHCRYLVPVPAHHGVLRCSENP